MPSRVRCRSLTLAAWLWITAVLAGGATPQLAFEATCPAPGWYSVLETFGLGVAKTRTASDIVIACEGAATARAEIDAWLRTGRILVLQGDSPLARSFGFVPSGRPAASIRNVKDHRAEELLIVWESPIDVEPTALPAGAQVLAEDRWSGTPLVATMALPQGNLLWLATAPGEKGYERYPLLANALADAGFVAPFRTRNLWAFFDSAYRQRVDLNFLADRWESFGIAGVHISAWQHWEPDGQKDAWLRRLIEACHRRGILVYAWMELPHVSERFWADHPECREKTALGQDAQLDWRKLVNLHDRSCSELVKAGAASLLERFNWDGVNLAEIYFESLEGYQNPARFTPLNPAVRKDFQAEAGFDPADLFRSESPQHFSRNPNGLARFLAWRRKLVAELHEDWLRFVEDHQNDSRDLHVIVTQIDDRFDVSVRESLGVDSASLLDLMHQHPFTFLVEDPATVWHLGPSRYAEIANAYKKVTPYPERLAVDINIFPRYQDVYPTKQQTGLELYRIVHAAAQVFPRVALYFEHVLAEADLPFLSAAAAPTVRGVRDGRDVVVESESSLGVRWQGPVRVNGRAWAAKDEETVWLPPGKHRLEPGGEDPPLVLRHFSGELRQISSSGRLLEFHYRSQSRAIATFDEAPARLWVDGLQIAAPVYEAERGYYLLLPAGEHLIGVEAAFDELPSQ